MKQLINLIPNSSFEQFKYNENSNRPNTIEIENWTISSEDQINSEFANHGSYSMSLKMSGDLGGSSLISIFENYNPRHKYYFRFYAKLPTGATNYEDVGLSMGRNIVSLFHTGSYRLPVEEYKDWNFVSGVIDVISTTANLYTSTSLWFVQKTRNNNGNRVLVDSVMLFDLTEAFGEGYEPSKEWIDENIPYFENKYDVEQLPKQVEFTCLNEFIYDEKSKKYYTNNLSPKITFVVRNVDKNYNSQEHLLNSIRFDYTSSGDKSFPTTVTDKLTLSDITIEYKDNDAYVTFNAFSFMNSRHHVVFDIYSDMSGGYRAHDSITVYFTHNYDDLEFNLDYNLSYSSTYLRKLKGTTNAYEDVPTNVDVFINGVKTSPVDILNQDDKLTVFEKDLYLSDGRNVINVVATDICGVTKSKSTEIYVDCMTPNPEKVDLLENFIGSDDNEISLKIGKARLKYQTPTAGLNKDIDIDTSVPTHYFELEGEKSNLYRISFDNIPKIQSDIIKRPIAINYDYVEKIYDGTNDITPEMRKLKLDDGYYFTDVHKEYNDYLGTGLVRGTSERKINQTVIYNQHDYIVGYIDLFKNTEWNTYDKFVNKLKEYDLIDSENDVDYFEKLVNQFKNIFEENEIINLFEYEVAKAEEYDGDNAIDIVKFIMNSDYKQYLTQIYIPLLGFYTPDAEFNTHSQYMFYNGFTMNFDGIELSAIPVVSADGRETSADLIGETNNCKSISNSKFEQLESGSLQEEGLYYSKYTLTSLEDNSKYYVYKAIDTRGCYSNNSHPIVAEFTTETLAKEWLLALHHSIKNIKLIRNSDDSTTIIFTFINDVSEYEVQSNVIIKYNYKTKNSDSDRFIFKSSDKGLIQTDFTKAFFKTEDVTDTVERITLNNISFVGDTLGDASNNYQIANYSAKGKILRRTINPHIRCLDKIYDGSNIVPIEIDDSEHYNGLENSIINDDVYLDTTYLGERMSETHKYESHGTTCFVYDDANVGTNKSANVHEIILEGSDAKNYNIGTITSNYEASILCRPINVVINKIRFYRTSKKYEVDYTILNDIKSDKLTICFNTNDDFDIKVFGGIDSEGNSIHQNVTGLDIKDMFFNYAFKTNYKFDDVQIDADLIAEKTQTSYYKDEVRPAEPDTERIDAISTEDINYPGEIKHTLMTLTNGDKTPYFESENKEYKLYSGCIVNVTNINLNPLHDKTRNYTLMNSVYETTIEII